MSRTLYQVQYDTANPQAKQWEELNLILRLIHKKIGPPPANAEKERETAAARPEADLAALHNFILSLGDINQLTPNEKQALLLLWRAVMAVHSLLMAAASDMAVTGAAVDQCEAALAAFGTFLNNGAAWDGASTPWHLENIRETSFVDGAELAARASGYFAAREALRVALLRSHADSKSNPHEVSAGQLFPSPNPAPEYVASFNGGYANAGYTSIAELRDAVGASPANNILYGTAPLTPGVSALETGTLYAQYEDV